MQRQLQKVLDAIAGGVVVIDAAGTIREMNAEACRLLETSLPSMRRRSVEDALGPDHVVSKIARGVLASGRGTQEGELAIRQRFASREVLVDVAASPLLDESGRTDGAVIELRDRTLHAALQEVVQERNRMSSFGHIAAGIAHEVKNPLGGIRGAAELVAKRADDERTRAAANLIMRESDRIATLLDDFMVLGRDEDLRLEPVNVHRVLDDVLDLLALDPVGGQVEVVREFDPSIPEFLADTDRLTQIFLNLVRNALQAMSESGGRLAITTRTSIDLHPARVPGGERVPSLVVEVRDTGSGIPAEVLEELSTPFFTTRPTGTGLGLTVSRHWVTRHDGRLTFDSVPGEGTTARVTLPLRRRR